MLISRIVVILRVMDLVADVLCRVYIFWLFCFSIFQLDIASVRSTAAVIWHPALCVNEPIELIVIFACCLIKSNEINFVQTWVWQLMLHNV